VILRGLLFFPLFSPPLVRLCLFPQSDRQYIYGSVLSTSGPFPSFFPIVTFLSSWPFYGFFDGLSQENGLDFLDFGRLFSPLDPPPLFLPRSLRTGLTLVPGHADHPFFPPSLLLFFASRRPSEAVHASSGPPSFSASVGIHFDYDARGCEQSLLSRSPFFRRTASLNIFFAPCFTCLLFFLGLQSHDESAVGETSPKHSSPFLSSHSLAILPFFSPSPIFFFFSPLSLPFSVI